MKELKGFVDRLFGLNKKVIVIVAAEHYFDLDFAENASAVVFAPFVVSAALRSLLIGESDFSGKLACNYGATYARGYGLSYDGEKESGELLSEKKQKAEHSGYAPSKECERARKFLLARAKKSGRRDERRAKERLSRMSPRALISTVTALKEQ